jgi:hypothetical protein
MLMVQGSSAVGQTDKKKLSPKEALAPFNELIGEWKATGVLKAKPAQAKDSFWTETHNWVWKFKGEDAWVKVKIHKGKYFTSGELRYLPDKGEYKFTLETVDNKTVVFTGTYEDRWLTLVNEDPATKETQKLVIRLLHSNRFLYQYDVLRDGKAFYTRIYQVGATKLGEEFASGDGRPECIVTGGLGTIKVAIGGETYYVCCSGCRDEFLSNPQKYIAAAKKKMK